MPIAKSKYCIYIILVNIFYIFNVLRMQYSVGASPRPTTCHQCCFAFCMNLSSPTVRGRFVNRPYDMPFLFVATHENVTSRAPSPTNYLKKYPPSELDEGYKNF